MRVLWIAFAVVVADQITKVWVRTTMVPFESIPIVGDLFRLTFTENPGMAFGLSLGSKLFLTLFSIVATALIGVYLWHVRRAPASYRIALALVLGGAIGNIIDRTFYGLVWGYAPLFYGNVVDFVHLDLSVLFAGGVWPDWLPYFGGRRVTLFPIGNLADLAIIGGVATILLTQKSAQEAMGERGESGESAESGVSGEGRERVVSGLSGEMTGASVAHTPVTPAPPAPPAVQPDGA
jgi:signal peptidase II